MLGSISNTLSGSRGGGPSYPECWIFKAEADSADIEREDGRAVLGSDGQRVRWIGAATFATLCLLIATSFVGYFALRHLYPGRTQVLRAGAIAWMASAFIDGVMLCALAVVYLWHLFRDTAAPRNTALWALLIVVFGPFAMAYYWTVYMRRLPHQMA